MWWDGHMGGWMWFGWIGGVLLIVLLVWVVLRAQQQGAGGSPMRDTPEDELKRRYARGEIDQQEYQRRLEDLRK